MGAWTPIYTPPVPLTGFYLQTNTSSIGNGYGVYNIGFGSGTPSVIPIQYGCFDGGFQGNIFLPQKVPANTLIQMQANEFNGSTDGIDVVLIGTTLETPNSSGFVQVMGSSSSSNFTTIGSGWTLFGTTLSATVKRITLLTGTLTGTDILNNLTFGIGASGSQIPLISNIMTAASDAYIAYAQHYDVEIEPNTEVWINGNGGSNSRAVIYLGY